MHCGPLQLFIFLCPCDDSHMHLTAPCSARALGQAHPTMSCIHLVVVPAGLQLISVDLFNTLLAFQKYTTELSNNSSTAVLL